jgi:hypothetical protein
VNGGTGSVVDHQSEFDIPGGQRFESPTIGSPNGFGTGWVVRPEQAPITNDMLGASGVEYRIVGDLR